MEFAYLSYAHYITLPCIEDMTTVVYADLSYTVIAGDQSIDKCWQDVREIALSEIYLVTVLGQPTGISLEIDEFKQ